MNLFSPLNRLVYLKFATTVSCLLYQEDLDFHTISFHFHLCMRELCYVSIGKKVLCTIKDVLNFSCFRTSKDQHNAMVICFDVITQTILSASTKTVFCASVTPETRAIKMISNQLENISIISNDILDCIWHGLWFDTFSTIHRREFVLVIQCWMNKMGKLMITDKHFKGNLDWTHTILLEYFSLFYLCISNQPHFFSFR